MTQPDTSAAAVERLARLIAMHGDDQDTAALSALLAEREEAIDQRNAADFVLALSIEQSTCHSVERDEARAEMERLRAEVARCEASLLAWIEAVGECNKDRNRLQAALALGIHMREAQTTYFKTRSKDALVAAKALEAEFLKRARALLEDGR